jgi:hypothetical protein
LLQTLLNDDVLPTVGFEELFKVNGGDIWAPSDTACPRLAPGCVWCVRRAQTKCTRSIGSEADVGGRQGTKGALEIRLVVFGRFACKPLNGRVRAIRPGWGSKEETILATCGEEGVGCRIGSPEAAHDTTVRGSCLARCPCADPLD